MTLGEKKLAYKAKQRAAELARRSVLGLPIEPPARNQLRKPQYEPRPVWGSQEWAETYSDNLGESFD